MKLNCKISKVILLVLLLLMAITPICDRYFKSLIVVLAILWFLQIFPSIFRHISKNTLIFSFFVVYIFLLKFIKFSTASIGNYIGITVFVICIMAFDYVQIQDEKMIKFIANAGMIIVFFNIISNIYATLKYPDIQEYVTNSQYFIEEYGYVNVFNTLDTYLLIFIVLSILIGIHFRRNLEYKRICMVIFCSYIIIFDLRRTTGILLFSAIVLFLIGRKLQDKINKRSRLIIIIGVFVLGIVFLLFWKNVWLFIAAHISEENIQKRLESLSKLFEFSMLNTNFSGDSFLQRMHMFFLDIQYWLMNFRTFICGNGYHREQIAGATTIFNAIQNKSCGHSTIGDMLAQYGIIGGIFLIMVFVHIKRIYAWALEDVKDYKYDIIMFIIVCIIVFWTNEIINPNIAVILFLVTPCYLRTERNMINGFHHK